MGKYQSSVEIVIAARDRASKVIDSVGQRFQRFGKQLSGLESSNQVLGALVGGGALAGVDQLGRKLAGAVDQTFELVDAWNEGKLSGSEFFSEMAKGTPVVGGFIEAGMNLRAWLDGSKAALDEANKAIQENIKWQKELDARRKVIEASQARSDQLEREIVLLRTEGDQTKALIQIEWERQEALKKIEQERRKLKTNDVAGEAVLDRQAELVNERARQQTTEAMAGFRDANQRQAQADADAEANQRRQADAIRRQNEELRLRNQGNDAAADVLAITNQYAAAIEQATKDGNDPLVQALEEQKRLRLEELGRDQARAADNLNNQIDKGLDDFFKNVDDARQGRDRGPQILEARFLGSVPQQQETAVADTARHTGRTAESMKLATEYLRRLLDKPDPEPVQIVMGRLN